MTPDQARRLLDGTTPGPWEWCEGKDQNGEFVALRGPDGVTDALRTWDGDLYASGVHGTNADKALAAAAPTLAAMIAGMREEYAIAYLDRDGNITLLDDGYETLAAAQRRRARLLAKVRPSARIMRRTVGEWEEA